MSNQHPELRSSKGCWSLFAQENASNPTSVNGKIVPKGTEVALEDEDEISFADVVFTFY